MGEVPLRLRTEPSSSALLLSSLELSDTKVYEPSIRALLGTASHFCEVVVLELRTVPTDRRPPRQVKPGNFKHNVSRLKCFVGQKQILRRQIALIPKTFDMFIW